MTLKNQPREMKFYTPITFSMYMKIPVYYYPYQLSTAVTVITADDNEINLESGNLPHILLSSVDKISSSFLSTVISCQQRLIADVTGPDKVDV